MSQVTRVNFVASLVLASESLLAGLIRRLCGIVQAIETVAEISPLGVEIYNLTPIAWLPTLSG
ncbi:MAG: hypothetical protein IT370_05650 [Deltaproteobacteria bacterium]|nr:hypothetical protein [Deltaproteobacteria bacterium]